MDTTQGLVRMNRTMNLMDIIVQNIGLTIYGMMQHVIPGKRPLITAGWFNEPVAAEQGMLNSRFPSHATLKVSNLASVDYFKKRQKIWTTPVIRWLNDATYSTLYRGGARVGWSIAGASGWAAKHDLLLSSAMLALYKNPGLALSHVTILHSSKETFETYVNRQVHPTARHSADFQKFWSIIPKVSGARCINVLQQQRPRYPLITINLAADEPEAERRILHSVFQESRLRKPITKQGLVIVDRNPLYANLLESERISLAVRVLSREDAKRFTA